MRNVFRTAAGLGVLLLTVTGSVFAQSQPDAQDLLNRAEERMFPESFEATFRMTTVKPNRRTTEMVMDNYHLEGTGSYIEVQEPSRSRGMRFLQKDEDLWMYNPRSGSRRAIRLSPRDSFQGSLFSNNDVADPDYVDDYNARLVGSETLSHSELGNVECWVIDAEATHPEAAYGRIRMWVRRSDDMPLRMNYYAKSGLLFKQMDLSGFKELAGAVRPTRMRMESMEQEGAHTEVVVERLIERDDLPARMFNQAQLAR